MSDQKSNVRKILFAATHRSGSYLACDWISKAAGLPFAEEYLNDNMLAARQEIGCPDTMEDERVFDALVSQKLKAHGAFCMKAMWPAYASYFSRELIRQGEKLETWGYHALKRFMPDAIFFVRRRDKIRQAVSFEIARQTGVWRSEDAAKNYDQSSLQFSYPRIAECLAEIEAHERAWLHFFTVNKLPYHEIVYEALITDPVSELSKAIQFLGLKISHITRPVSRFKRQGSEINKLWADDVRQRQNDVKTAGCASPAAPAPSQPTPGTLDAETSFSIRWVNDSALRLAPGSPTLLKVTIHNHGARSFATALDQRGLSNWILRVESSTHDSDERKRLVWHHDFAELPQPGEYIETFVRYRYDEPDAASIRLSLDLIWNQASVAKSEYSLTVHPDLDEGWHYLARVFGDVKMSPWRDFIDVPHFGSVWPKSFPWIHFSQHGFIKVDAAQSRSGYLVGMDLTLGQVAISLDEPDRFIVNPNNPQCARILRFQGLKENFRTFIDENTGEFVRILKKGAHS